MNLLWTGSVSSLRPGRFAGRTGAQKAGVLIPLPGHWFESTGISASVPIKGHLPCGPFWVPDLPPYQPHPAV